MVKTAGLAADFFSQYLYPNIQCQKLTGLVKKSAREADGQCIKDSDFKQHMIPRHLNSAALTHFVRFPSVFLMHDCHEKIPTETNMMQSSLLNEWSIN